MIDRLPCIQKVFLGVFAIDQLPAEMPELTCLIFNYDTSQQSGSHWACIIRNRNIRCGKKQRTTHVYEIFDSLGVSYFRLLPHLKFPEVLHPDTQPKAHMYFNSYPFQKTTSSSCGFFALYYLIHRMMNLTEKFHDWFHEIFYEDPEKNEKRVSNFINNMI
jgi:hypothetical protein